MLPSPAPPGGSGLSCHLGWRQECGFAEGHLIRNNKQHPSKRFLTFRYGAGHIRADRPAKTGFGRRSTLVDSQSWQSNGKTRELRLDFPAIVFWAMISIPLP